MTKRSYGTAKSGKPIDDELIEQLADEAEVGYDAMRSSLAGASMAAAGQQSASSPTASRLSGSTSAAGNE